MQTASMQDRVPPQSLPSWHFGAASPVVSQNPPTPQTDAAVHVQQSVLLWHAARQKPSTQDLPSRQSRLVWQLGCGRSSGWQSPSEHMSCDPQSASPAQAGWQVPLMHVSAAGAGQLAFSTQDPPVLG
jgi:hypothetical protein